MNFKVNFNFKIMSFGSKYGISDRTFNKIHPSRRRDFMLFVMTNHEYPSFNIDVERILDKEKRLWLHYWDRRQRTLFYILNGGATKFYGDERAVLPL